MVTSRILFTAKQKDELWERWKNGQSVLAISRALERRNKTGVQRIVALNGGIAPAPRCRAVAALKLEEREEISRGIAAGRSSSARRRSASNSRRSQARDCIPASKSRSVPFPACFAAYIATSALRRRSSGRFSGDVLAAMPTLAVTTTSRPSERERRLHPSQDPLRDRTASFVPASSRSTVNSSPPSRATVSPVGR